MSSPRLGYLLKKFPRLSETFVLNEILGLERQGWPIHVFSRRTPDAEPRHPELAELRAEVIELGEIDPWPVLLSPEGRRELLPRVAALVDGAASWRHRKFPGLLGEALHLLPLLRQRSVTHLHAHFATDSAVVAALARELGGPRYSVTLHAKDIYREGVDFGRLERIIDGAELAVTVCDANVRHLAAHLSGRAMAKVRRLYNGIDLNLFAAPSGGPRDPDHILAVGRLVEKKGLDVLLRGVAALARDRPSVRVTIAGEGDDRARLEAMVGELGLAGRVELVGALDQAAVRELMARATVLCQPCVVGPDGNQDALPTVLLEAMASGLPVVTTPVGGIPEIVDGGRAGVMVPAGDAEATGRALAELLASPARRGELARAGRRRAELLFDGRVNSGILSAWLSDAVEGDRSPERAAVPASARESEA